MILAMMRRDVVMSAENERRALQAHTMECRMSLIFHILPKAWVHSNTHTLYHP